MRLLSLFPRRGSSYAQAAQRAPFNQIAAKTWHYLRSHVYLQYR